MSRTIDHSTLHRAAKYFMDSGKAVHGEAMELLERFGLTILLGREVVTSAAHQTALLTIVNVARRTLLAGVEIVGLSSTPCLSPLAPDRPLDAAVTEFGGPSSPNRDRTGLPQ